MVHRMRPQMKRLEPNLRCALLSRGLARYAPEGDCANHMMCGLSHAVVARRDCSHNQPHSCDFQEVVHVSSSRRGKQEYRFVAAGRRYRLVGRTSKDGRSIKIFTRDLENGGRFLTRFTDRGTSFRVAGELGNKTLNFRKAT